MTRPLYMFRPNLHSRAMGGAGLGLAMTEKIIQKHHGSIQVKDNENGGSYFKIVL
ncbi:ATP-binding protein [Ruminococcus sp.]|uniref:ATP-binding protein n=1 Tax=Ruminococcus sp. TaxID=41978 RepID=UPI00342CBB03